jgi:hypothetical protein
MTNNEAKFVLSAYRPNGVDASNPAMADALKQVKSDPTLNAWFVREQAHDAAIATKLREITPPAGLREAIVAGVRAGESNRGGNRSRSYRPVWLAIAAAVAVLLGSVTWWQVSSVKGRTLDEFAVNFVARGFLLSKRSADLGELKGWLAERRGPLPAELPAEFNRLRALGCKSLNFQNHDVSLVCFERGGKEFHVFVARRDDFPAFPVRLTPEIGEAQRKLVTAKWSDANNHYVVVSDGSLADVKALL